MQTFLFLLFFLLQVDPHPIHITVSEVEISESSIDWTIMIYKDDLLLGVYGKKAGFEKLTDESKIKEDVFAYLKRHIKVSASSSGIDWQLADIQSDQEAIWTTLRTKFVLPEDLTLEIINSVLMKEYSDQKNIIHCTFKEETKSLVFEQGDDVKQVSF
ncbi:MAG TPA: DUF6702 family protein [Saprospiraceae bacterium]